MTSAETFTFLQQPQIALPICALACAVVALVLRRFWTAGALVLLTGLFLLNWQLAFVTEGAAVILHVTLLFAFFGVATWERAWTVLYVALMPVINWSFAAVPTAAIPAALGGGQFQPLAIVTGLVLVVRETPFSLPTLSRSNSISLPAASRTSAASFQVGLVGSRF